MTPGNLTKNFTLAELTESATARKRGYNEQFTPPDEVCDNLQLLCERVLQPLRDFLGPVRVTSGYRCDRLNAAVGGKPTSQHRTGMAADLQFFVDGRMDNRAIVDTILVNKIEFDQMIWENGGEWVHISYNKARNRKHYFTANK